MKPVDAHVGGPEVAAFGEVDAAALDEAEGIATRTTKPTRAATWATPRAIGLGVRLPTCRKSRSGDIPRAGPTESAALSRSLCEPQREGHDVLLAAWHVNPRTEIFSVLGGCLRFRIVDRLMPRIADLAA
jgi:hypothetical protein